MSETARLFVVAALLAVLLAGAAVLAGYPSVLSPGQSEDAGHSEREAASTSSHSPAGTDERAGGASPGVQVAEDGLRLAVERATFTSGAPGEPFSFRILDAQGRPVRDFEVTHERKMHFIVVRRDLTGFQHLHPAMRPDGAWSTRLDFGEGGSYRVFADFTRDAQQRTLGADVQVGGVFRPRPLPAATRVVRSDGGLKVALNAGAASAGKDARLEFEVRDRGQVVTDRLQPLPGRQRSSRGAA